MSVKPEHHDEGSGSLTATEEAAVFKIDTEAAYACVEAECRAIPYFDALVFNRENCSAMILDEGGSTCGHGTSLLEAVKDLRAKLAK